MTGFLSAGDTDILRDASRPGDIFLARLRRSARLLTGAALLTLPVAGVIAVLVLGPSDSGLAWATRELVAGILAPLAVIWLLYLGWALFKLMPGRNERVILGLRRWVRSGVDGLDERIRALSDDELRAKRAEFQQRLTDGQTLDDVRAEAYACVREASRRARNHRQFECQLIGGRVIEDCKIAEMRTGEGKTIVCYMANFMKVLQGLKVHMVTVNDYLVKRDADFCRPIFELLGCTVGYITADMPTWGEGVEVRRAAYACDITYGTNSEFGFDYLRDNMKTSVRDQVQGRQDFVVVDEVDSILIDEARTPLIISGPAHDDVGNYRVADNIARMLIRKQEQAVREMRERIDQVERDATGDLHRNAKFRSGLRKFRAEPLWLSSDEAELIGFRQHFVVELDRKSAHMTDDGARAAQAELSIGTFYDSKNMNWPHYIDNALKAHLVYTKDKEYVVQDGEIIIVDEFTGRMMHGRQWSDGLHQAVEAKEKVTIKQETQTLATITLQNLFKLYRQLAGMTGTAMTESDEFMRIYKLEVIAIPTNRPVYRIDYNDKIYKSQSHKYDAIVEEIRSYSQNGYPADPWSLYDILRPARRRIEETLRASQRGVVVGLLRLLRGAVTVLHELASLPTGARLRALDSASAAIDRALLSRRRRQLDPARWPGREAEARQLLTVEEALNEFTYNEQESKVLEEAYLKLAGGDVGGRPVLVGTTSVENSEKLSNLLTQRYGIEHEVLNAKNHAREAEIVAKAGQQHEAVRGKHKAMHGNVTIATNMAGRGTDIVLGPGVARIGGLHVVGTERHEARRIDNQLRGRCGRQGDPGSSRFYLSLEDDLLKLFMAEWMLRMLGKYAMVEGMPLESRQLTRNIQAAQKKVEERNFGIRKNLLEYDEVMDYQRKTFYEMRQRVVEGRDLSELVWEMIDESVNDAVDRFFDPMYPARCAAESVAQSLGVSIEANKLDTDDVTTLSQQVRDLAGHEVRGHVQRVFGEYVDPGADPEEWDIRGLVSWAAQYGITLNQRQVRESDPQALMDQLIQAAVLKIEEADLASLQPFVDKQLPRERLIQWAQEKFGLALTLADLDTASRDEAARILRERMRTAYKRREIEYPVGAVIDMALRRGGQNVNEVYARIANWVNRKYRLNWTYAHFEGKDPKQIFQELRALNEEYLMNGKLDSEIDAALRELSGEPLLAWARDRFGAVLEMRPVTLDDTIREQLRRCGYEMLRYELTHLERLVVLSTLDAIWKDHMYGMDLLRHGIGLRGYAERDPKIEYKREGTRLFNEMMSAIRERVTDLIFKVQLPSDDEFGGGPPAAASPSGGAYAQASTSKADATGAGFASVARDREAAMRQQGETPVTQTFRREAPTVGRNDPCPCGSGKKYKNCHGKAR